MNKNNKKFYILLAKEPSEGQSETKTVKPTDARAGSTTPIRSDAIDKIEKSETPNKPNQITLTLKMANKPEVSLTLNKMIKNLADPLTILTEEDYKTRGGYTESFGIYMITNKSDKTQPAQFFERIVGSDKKPYYILLAKMKT
jgi:hypothetical protein